MKKNILAGLLLFLIAGISQAQNYRVTIRVIIPDSTPSSDTLFVVGNDPAFGKWFFPNGAKMNRESDSSRVYSAEFPKNTHLEFKITRGSYFKEAMFNYSSYAPSTSLTVLSDTTIILKPLTWNDQWVHSITGTLRYHHNMSDSKQKYTRDVIVWLPPSYLSDSKKRYPVLYMHDGQNLMDASSSGYGREWRVDEVSDSLIKAGAVEEYIVVGIANTKDRWVDYSGDEEGRNYADFIVHTIKPFIDTNYRTKPDRENTAVMGSSMGGNISFYILWWYPDVFSKAASLSGAFIYDEGGIMKKIGSMKKPSQDIHLYLDCGDKGIDEFFRDSNRAMYKILQEKGIKDVVYYDYPGADHNEIAWANRIWRPLEFLFPLNDGNKK